MPAIQRRGLRAAFSCALILALGACEELQIIPADECGNGVVEPRLDEDCDGEADCGAPGTERACRLVCTGPGATCRDGYACGLDGVCRRPSGGFEVLSATATPTVLDLSAGDVNVDGCDELLISKRLSVTLVASESNKPGLCPAGVQDIPSGRAPDKELGRPAVVLADMNRDGRPDLVRAGQGQYGDALFVDVAGASPAFGAILYPTLKALESPVRPLRVTVNGADALLLFLDGIMGKTEIGIAGVVDPKNTPRPSGAGFPGVTMADLVLLEAARLNTDSPSDDVLVGFAGQNVLLSMSLSMVPDPMIPGTDKISVTTPKPAVTLPQGATLRTENASMAVVDHDGDGTLDVIVNSEAGSPMAKSPLYVAYGTGDGRFHSTSPPDKAAPDGMASQLALPPVGPMTPSPELGEAIFVAADFEPAKPGIEIEAIPCPPSPALDSSACNPTEDLGCEAVVFDIDADGRLDIVSTQEQQPGFAVRRPASTGGFHVSFVDTSCPPHELTVGDFDDDGISDLAYFDQTVSASGALSSEEDPVDTLMIAYGNAYADQSPPLASGQFPTSLGLTAGRFSPMAPVTQLYAARELQEAEVKSGFALIEGYGERRLFAPYYFPYPPPEGGAMPSENIRQVEIIAGGAGLFGKDSTTGEATHAVAVVTRDLDSDEPASPILQLVDARLGGGALIEADVGEAPTCDGCVLVPIDIPECQGAGGPDELLLLGADELILYSVVTTGMQNRFAFEECDRFTSTGHTFSFRDEDPKPEKYAPRPLVADLDLDGRADVLARDAEGDLVVLWSQTGGGFEPQALSFPAGGAAALPCNGKCSAALVDVDGDVDASGDETDGRELLVAAPGGLRLYRIRRDRTLESLALPAGLGDITVAQNTDYTAVVAADLDGDGVEDLALMPSSSLLVTLRGVPENK